MEEDIQIEPDADVSLSVICLREAKLRKKRVVVMWAATNDCFNSRLICRLTNRTNIEWLLLSYQVLNLD